MSTVERLAAALATVFSHDASVERHMEWTRGVAEAILAADPSLFDEARQQGAREAEQYRAALRRLCSPDEMAGFGITEEMTGPAAEEMRARMRYACYALAEPTADEASDGGTAQEEQ